MNVNKPRTIYAQSSCKKRVLAHFVSSKNLPWFQDSSWILPQKSRSILTLITKTIFGALWKQPWFQGNSWILPWFQRNSSDIFKTSLISRQLEFSTMSHSRVLKKAWKLFSETIFLSLHRVVTGVPVLYKKRLWYMLSYFKLERVSFKKRPKEISGNYMSQLFKLTDYSQARAYFR